MIEVPAAITISGILRLGRQRRRGKRRRGNAEAGDEIDLVVDDQFLREALGVVGNRAVILQDDLDLLAGDGVALLLHVELDRVVDLLAGRRLAAGHRQDQADLHGLLRLRRRKRQPRRRARRRRRPATIIQCESNMNALPWSVSCLEPSPRPLPHHSPDLSAMYCAAAWRLISARHGDHHASCDRHHERPSRPFANVRTVRFGDRSRTVTRSI